MYVPQDDIYTIQNHGHQGSGDYGSSPVHLKMLSVGLEHQVHQDMTLCSFVLSLHN